jgi:hypothetical protein
MNALWIIMLMIAHNNGQVEASIQYALDPQYNNEKSCNEVGQQVADQAQLKVGLDNAKVYWKCDVVPLESIKKLFPGEGI